MKFDFQQNEKNGVFYYTSGALSKEPGIRHCFSTRLGGVSEGPYRSLNLGLSTGDERESVLQNIRLLCDAAGFRMASLVFTKQVHGDRVESVTTGDRGAWLFKKARYEEADALVTNQPGVALAGFFADCVPVLLYDPKTPALGVAHAGWRGTVKRIAAKAVQKMASEYFSDPCDILAAVGPSIHPCCFEVGKEVADEFFREFPQDGIVGQKAGRFYCDLPKANAATLLGAGLLEENISLSGLCTKCRHDEFYSHRASGGRRGSLGVFAELK